MSGTGTLRLAFSTAVRNWACFEAMREGALRNISRLVARLLLTSAQSFTKSFCSGNTSCSSNTVSQPLSCKYACAASCSVIRGTSIVTAVDRGPSPAAAGAMGSRRVPVSNLPSSTRWARRSLTPFSFNTSRGVFFVRRCIVHNACAAYALKLTQRGLCLRAQFTVKNCQQRNRSNCFGDS
jgi:hypothetical protein